LEQFAFIESLNPHIEDDIDLYCLIGMLSSDFISQLNLSKAYTKMNEWDNVNKKYKEFGDKIL